MKRLLIVLIVLPLFAYGTLHKYYISVTQIDYVPEKESLQIITRIFIDDFERLIRERYDENITLAEKDEPDITDLYIERYLNEKINVKVNGKDVDLIFIGKEYDVDIMRCYLEIENVKSITSFEISNKVLFDVFDDQQNIIKTNISGKRKSFILISKNESAMLNFK